MMRSTWRSTVLSLAALALAGCMSTPPEQDPVQIKLNDLDVRLTRTERMLQNGSLLQVSNQLESLRADVRAMHNDVDQLNNTVEQSRKQQRDLYADLDQRLKVLEGRGGAAPTPGDAAGGAASGAAASAAAPAAVDDKSSYQAAFNLLKEGQYDRAVTGFKGFLGTYPSSALADNAQYWLGEAYYVNKSFPEAQAAFQKVIDKYPDSAKVPDALLKIGFCRYETKQWDGAKSVLSQVVVQYPDTPSAKLAQQRLDRMATEKH
jgi:tol-pal system protein YbgF